ncbi:MAG: VCBS repeat-containing protein [Bacteroidia bacterium]|nr:VCBS repeat-containing protein [Bacteroidia bacterium]
MVSPASAQQHFTKVNVGPVVTDSSNTFDAGWGDYDNDGDLDLIVTTRFGSAANPLGKNFLYVNNCNGEFTRVTAIPGGLTTDRLGYNCHWIDYDNDDDLDLYLSVNTYLSYNVSANDHLYRNNGDGTFTKITDDPVVNDGKQTYGSGWADYDNDGYLDLYTANRYTEKSDLYHNNGDGTFTKIVGQAIVTDVSNNMAAAWADFDNDGDMDLFVSNAWLPYNYRSYLYINNGDGTFTNDVNNTAVNDPRITWWKMKVSWSCAVADYDNDLDIDIFVQSEYTNDYLYSNNGDGQFTAVLDGPVVNTYTFDNGGNCFGDYDNDGDLDLFVTSMFAGNFLYDNNGDGTFTRNTTETIVQDFGRESYGAAWADYDNDGDLDLIVPNAYGGPSDYFYISLFANNGNGNHWFKVTCKGVITNRDAIGARVYVKAQIAGQDIWQMREINGNSAYGGGGGGAVSGLVCHFGLGDATVIDTLKVVWPTSGITQVFTGVGADQYVKIFEDDNTIYPVEPCTPDLPVTNPGYITGKVYKDDNDNCIYDIPDIDNAIVNRMIQATPGPYFVYTNREGDYEFRLNAGTYDITQTFISNDNWNLQTCQPNNTYTVSVTSASIVSGINFPLQPLEVICDASVDIVSIPSIFPGPCTLPPIFQNLTSPCPGYKWEYCVVVTNTGTTNTGPQSQLQVILDPNMTFSNLVTGQDPCGLGNPGACTPPSPQCLQWSIPLLHPPDGLIPGESCSICFDVDVPGLGPVVSSSANFTAVCGNQTDVSTDAESYLDNCSCDPNDKLVAPKGCGPFHNISKNQLLTYTVRFQNTGTGPAHNIVIRDAFNSDFDITTLQILASSHTITHTEIIPNNALIISFEGIELPDSASNPAGSNGFVTFNLYPIQNLADGTTITNQAGIYFDFNEVVLTNTTVNTLREHPYPIADFEYKHSCTNTGLVYDFTYTGGTDDNAIFLWDFGSNAMPGTSTEMNPANITFNSTGSRQVTLTIERYGCIAAITKDIEVVNYITGKNKDKIIICHIPPGNPSNPQTIEVNLSSLPAHLAHGDCIGSCFVPSLKKTNQSDVNDEEKSINNIVNSTVVFDAFPNPFADKTNIFYSVPIKSNISIRVYNSLGILVSELYNGETKNMDTSTLFFDSSGLSPGIYCATLESAGVYSVVKLVIVK